jgi:hypothetical protein
LDGSFLLLCQEEEDEENKRGNEKAFPITGIPDQECSGQHGSAADWMLL